MEADVAIIQNQFDFIPFLPAETFYEGRGGVQVYIAHRSSVERIVTCGSDNLELQEVVPPCVEHPLA